MCRSNFHRHCEKETSAEAEIASHRLMLKAGMLRRLDAGLYTWSPLGLRVGDMAKWQTPHGEECAATIESIQYQPEATGDYLT